MIIGYVQSSPEFGKRDPNFEQVYRLTEGLEADLLVLPELFASGYAFSSREEAASLAEDTGGPTARFLRDLADRIGGAVVAGFPEKSGSSLYNSSMLVDSGGVLGVYRKIHLFAREKEWFSPGDRPFAVYPLPSCVVGMMVCFDWMFPEAARSLAILGARVIAHPANLVLPYCQEAMKTRCLENRVFAVTANRIGNEKRGDNDLTFTGMSQVIGCRGEVFFRSDSKNCGVQTLEIDPDDAYDKRVTVHNDIMEDRRPELYITKKGKIKAQPER